jgi:D-alanyl-D-alanine endopeptidase (penicillin-binding protein 7)
MMQTTGRTLKWMGGVALLVALSLTNLSHAQTRKPQKAHAAKTSVAKKAVVKKPVAQKTVAKKSARNPVVAKRGNGTRTARAGSAARKAAVAGAAAAAVTQAAARPSMGEKLGLRNDNDPLDLNSSVAFVVDQETNEVLLRKNETAVLPIASLTKLMTGLVVVDAQLPMDEMITISQADVDTLKGSGSRLAVGTTLSRGELMHLALMSSENRAAHALGRTFPGGLSTFVTLMNAKAGELGMNDTRYVEPTGLSSDNRSSAKDLATLAAAAYERPMLRDLSTSPSHQVDVGRRTVQFNNSNRLVHNPDWSIGLQKTGYISEAGRCLVMQANVAGRQVIMVFLDAAGKAARVGDAERVRRWVEQRTQTLMQFAKPAS